MTTGAIVTMVVMWLVFIGAFVFAASRLGKGSKWED